MGVGSVETGCEFLHGGGKGWAAPWDALMVHQRVSARLCVAFWYVTWDLPKVHTASVSALIEGVVKALCWLEKEIVVLR